MSVDTIDVIFAQSSKWYDDIIFYLTHRYAPPTIDFKKCRTLRLEEMPYQFIDNVFFHKNYDVVFLRCLEKTEADIILVDMLAGLAGGHLSRETTAHKVLRAGYYWPMLFKDGYNYVIKCEPCQRCAGKLKKPTFPLQLVTA